MKPDLQDLPVPPAPGRVVLDTNVVLDAWWFDDPATRKLRSAIEAGRQQWLLTTAMVAEARDVLQRPPFAHHADRCERVLLSIDRFAEHRDAPASAASLRCHDPDDQIFLDLALALRPCWLLSRDAALLTLAGRADAWSCRIATPAVWAEQREPG